MQNKTKKPEKTISLPNLPGIIITVVLIVGIGAVYGLMGYLVSGIKENVTPVIQKPVQKPSMEITDWKVYQNEEYGFEFKYPESWFYSRDKQEEGEIDYKLHIGFAESIKILNQGVPYSIEFMIWSDRIGVRDSDHCDYEILKKKNNKQYVLRTCDFNKYEKIMDKMVESFKFIEEDETADWQTYWNEESGLEVKYPSEYPDGSNVVIEDFSNYFIKILNFEYLEEIGMFPDRNDETEDDFIVELLKRTGADAASYTFQIEKDFDEYQGIKIFGGNEFYSGYNYGPIDAKTYIYKNDTNVRISFYKNYTDNLISGILSTFKFIEKDETVDENKPSIYPSKGRGSLLLLNGEKTGFYAYEFEKENIILFQEEIYDKEKARNHYSLKTISTRSPYEIKTLIDNKHTNCMDNGRFLGEKNNVYFFETGVDAPGRYYELFLFDPVNMNFVLIINFYRYFDGPHLISLYSSVSRAPFNIEKRSRISLRTGEILLPNDNDIEIIFNEKSFTKKEVDQGEADYIKDIFNYNFKPFELIDIDEINNKESNGSVDAYLKYFPKKIPYFTSGWYNYEGTTEDFWVNPDRYFDFEKNEFISSL